MIKANFFWHGPALSLYEAACLTSFVREGMDVRLHTFNAQLQLPPGVRRCDAAALAHIDEVHAYTQGGHRGSIAAFTDIFRYRVLQQETGWWFDTDVMCLQSADVFAALEHEAAGLLVGEEAPGKLNGAVLYVGDTSLAAALEQRADNKGFEFEWGDIGPQLITAFLQEVPARVTVMPPATFYPVHYLETAMLFRKDAADTCRARAAGAVCVHLWNEFLRRWDIPKNVLPPEGSYLHALFCAHAVRVAPDAALPEESFESLRHSGEIGRVGNQALRIINRAKRIKAAVVGR